MDLLAQKRVLFVLIFLSTASFAWAREDLFRLSRVDYFDMKARPFERPETGYGTPRVVIDLLDHPDEATALEYLRWQRERMQKIARAQQILDKLMASFPPEALP